MLDRIFGNIRDFGDRKAFYIGKEFYSYRELGNRIDAIRLLLREAYKGAVQQPTGIYTADSLDTYAAILAFWAERQIFIPLNPTHPAERNLNITRQAGIKLILYSEAVPEAFMAELSCVNMKDAEPGESFPDPVPGQVPEDIRYILFTSGSTGIPKGVRISDRNISSFVHHFIEAGYEFSPDDRFLQIYDLSFDASVHCYTVPLTVGACVYTVPQHEIKYLYAYKLMSEQQLTFVKMPPSTLVYLKPYFSRITLPALRFCLLGGEACHENIVREWQPCVPNAQIQNVYGPTEATINCTLFPYTGKNPEDVQNGVVSIGKPFGENSYLVLGDGDKAVEQGETGELCISGSQVTPGYLNNPEKNREAFISLPFNGRMERFYRTGDLVKVNKHGNIMYLGRMDNQVQVDGYRVELGEIESRVMKFTGGNAYVFARIDDNGKPLICVAAEGYKGEASAIMAYLENELPKYMLPRKISVLDEFPHTSGGKIDTGKLKKLFNDD